MSIISRVFPSDIFTACTVVRCTLRISLVQLPYPEICRLNRFLRCQLQQALPHLTTPSEFLPLVSTYHFGTSVTVLDYTLFCLSCLVQRQFDLGLLFGKRSFKVRCLFLLELLDPGEVVLLHKTNHCQSSRSLPLRSTSSPGLQHRIGSTR